LKLSTVGLGREARVLGETFLGFGGWVRGFGCDFSFPEGWVGEGFTRVMILFLFLILFLEGGRGWGSRGLSRWNQK
jgi:hypothetical protein